MKKLIALFLLCSVMFSLSVSHKLDASGITFIVNDTISPKNLTIFILHNGENIKGYSTENEEIPYITYILTKDPGVYTFRVVDDKGHFVEDIVNVSKAEFNTSQNKQESQLGMLTLGAGFLIVVFILIISFIKIKKH